MYVPFSVVDLLDPDLLVRGTDPAPDPSVIKHIVRKKNLHSYCFVTSFFFRNMGKCSTFNK
jgi:hypothetical protein